MAFRRSSEDARDKQRWKSFVNDHFVALCDIGIPEHVFRDKSNFDHWLMHGYHPADPVGFTPKFLDPERRRRLVRLLRSYLEAGFKDPGISFVTEEERGIIFGMPDQTRNK